MDREKQIEEMAYEIETRLGYLKSTCYNAANVLYHAGYRKQRQGKWEELIGERWFCSERCEKYTYYVCSECGKRQMRESPFCPNCGKIMKGGDSDA